MLDLAGQNKNSGKNGNAARLIILAHAAFTTPIFPEKFGAHAQPSRRQDSPATIPGNICGKNGNIARHLSLQPPSLHERPYAPSKIKTAAKTAISLRLLPTRYSGNISGKMFSSCRTPTRAPAYHRSPRTSQKRENPQKSTPVRHTESERAALVAIPCGNRSYALELTHTRAVCIMS